MENKTEKPEVGIDVRTIETGIADLIQRNDPRREAIKGSRDALAEIDQKVDQKRKALAGMLDGEVLETAIRAYHKQLRDGISNADLPEGSYSDLQALKAVFERFVSLLETEIRETTLTGKNTGRKGRKGQGAWFHHPEVRSEFVETGIYRVQDPYTGVWYANQNSASRAIQNNNPIGYERIINRDPLFDHTTETAEAEA